MAPLKRKLEDTDANSTDAPISEDKEKSSKQKKQKCLTVNEEMDDLEFNSSQNPDFDVPVEAEVGIVERVSVTNFMCHRKLEVKLGPNMNFIIGRNGSGKSAILTGLIVGLGGKANITSRGNSLRGFIKEGCSYCTIQITLRNRGSDAWKPLEYGRSIIVERKVSVDGGSTYKMKSADNKVISNKKEELLSILDQFNIQIDNPVSILTQDTARSFLNTSDPKDKYAFFLKATQLEQMSTDYQRIIEETVQIKETLSRKKKALPELAAAVKLHEEKYKDMQQLEGMKEEIQTLKKKYAWALVKEKNADVEERHNYVIRLKDKLPAYQEKVDSTKQKEEEFNNVYLEKCTEFSNFEEETGVLVNEKGELQKEYKQRRQACKNAQEKRRRLERDISIIERDLKALHERIEEIRMSAQRDLESEQQQREAAIEEKQNEVQRVEAQLSTSNHHKSQLERAIKNGKDQKYQLNNEYRDVQRQIDNKRNRLQQLESHKQNKLLQFGRSTPALLKAIDMAFERGKFHKKPVGPLGSLINLKEPKWALAIEEAIKPGLLTSYACHDSHDLAALKEIFRRSCKERQPTIIMSSFVDYFYDTSRFRPRCNYPTVLDLLDIDNAVVHNTLIDQTGIEQVLLIEDAKHAQNVLWFEKPQNVHKALTLHGHEVLGGRSSKYYPCKKNQPSFLQADVVAATREVEGELLQCQQNLTEVHQRLRQLDAELKREHMEFDRTKRICNQQQDTINNLHIELQELQSFEAEQLPDVDELEQEVVEYEGRKTMMEGNLQEAFQEESQAKESVQEQEMLLQKCQERCQDVTATLEKLMEQRQQAEHGLAQSKGHRKHYMNKLEEFVGKINEAEKGHATIQNEYETLRSQAQEYCEEVETNKTAKHLEGKIMSTQKRIDREEARRGNVKEVRDSYHTALSRYTDAKNSHDNCVKLRKALDKAMNRRARRYEKFKVFLTTRARTYFQMLLSQRGYDGKMKINHDEETLLIEVNVENTKGDTTKDSKALSGGERSFSTICFIMALWEAMESPFRCLDEFDVFMDMLNRRIAMNMLRETAQQKTDKQFILLTPQDMSNISGNSYVRIFQLRDPERGQQTLPYRPV